VIRIAEPPPPPAFTPEEWAELGKQIARQGRERATETAEAMRPTPDDLRVVVR